MSVQELNRVHRRYIRTSNHFKSAWTFHQFVQGLRKTFPDVGPSNYPADFQSVYGDLKQVSQNLAETTAELANRQLEQVERGLAPMTQSLLASDDAVSPSLLRQFFQRVKNYDDNILAQLLKFYLYSQDGPFWSFERLDKSDFLCTKLLSEFSDSKEAFVLRDQTFLRETIQGLWVALDVMPTPETELVEKVKELRQIQSRIAEADSIDALHQRNSVEGYRDFKHSLGHQYFEPRLLPEILTTNLSFKNHIHRLYKRDEQRIIAEYQQVFELERDVPIDIQLGEELDEFRQAVDRFEKQLEGDSIRLKEIAGLRAKVRSLVPKLSPDEESGKFPLVVPPEAREMQEVAPEPPVLASASDKDAEIIEAYLQTIVEALEDTNPTADAKRVALQPEIFTLGVSPREIKAYRRLFGGASCDREVEQFLLQGAALRAQIEHDVDEIKGILDDTAVTQDAPIFQVARKTCASADRFLRRFEHYIHELMLAGDLKEARSILRLKMRLMRAYSGLWLMVYR